MITRLGDVYFSARARPLGEKQLMLCTDIEASESRLRAMLESLELDKPMPFAVGGQPEELAILTRRDIYTPSLVSGHSSRRASHHACLIVKVAS